MSLLDVNSTTPCFVNPNFAYFHSENCFASSCSSSTELSAGKKLAYLLKLYFIFSKFLFEFQAALSIQTYEYVKNFSVSISIFIASKSEPVIPLINSVNLFTSSKVLVCK